MNSQLHDIMHKRAQLLVRIEGQREQVAAAGARWKTPFAVADQGFAAGRYLRTHPLLLATVAGLVALVAIRRHSALLVANSALRLWNLYKTARLFAARIASRR